MSHSRTSLFHFGAQVLTSVAGFLTTLIISRLLGAEVLGTFAVITSLVIILVIPSNAIGGAMSKRISEREAPWEYFTAGIIVIAALLAVLIVALSVANPLLEEYIGAPVGGLLILLIVGSSAYNLYTSVLVGEKKVVAKAALGTLEQVLQLILQAGIVALGYGLAGLVVGKIASFAIAALVGVFVSDLRLTLPNRHHFQRLYDFAKYTWMGQIKGRSFSWIDVLILGFFINNTLIGIYQVSWTLASTLILVSYSIQNTLFPEISELGVDNDVEQIHHLLTEALTFLSIFAIPGLFGAAIIGRELLTIYRPQFALGYGILLILILARTFDAYANQFTSVISGYDRPELVFRTNVVFVVINTLLNFVLIWAFGWYGAAVATAFSALVELVLAYYYVTTAIGYPEIPYRQILYQFVAAAGMAVVLYTLTQHITVNNYSVVATVFIGAAVYLILLLIISKPVRQKFRMLAPAWIPE